LAGQIQANELAVVNGQGANIDISNVANNIGTFAVDQAGDLTLISDTALTVGSVNPTGITATGDVFVATVNGDLTIAEDISTSSTSATAMVLAAGTSASAGGDGTPSAGNVVIGTTSTNTTPSLSVGTGGTIGVYTGGINGSSGLASLVSQGDFRYNTSITSSGVVTAGYTTPLATDAVNAIYREQPVLTVVIDDAVIDYSYSPNNTLSSLTGFVNGDTQANALNSVSFTVTPGAAGTSAISGNLNVGEHDIRLSSATNPLGYDIQDTAAKLNVNQLASATWGGGNGNWSDPTNWFVTGTSDAGALPDGNNVALAILPNTFTGTLTSDVDHGHQGKIAIEGGVLSVGSDLRLGAVPGSAVPDLITISDSGKLQASSGFTMNANRGIVLAAPAGVSDTGARGIEVTTGTLTVQGPVSGGGNLTKTGAGALALENAANSYGGGTTVDAGELIVVQTQDVLGSGNLTLSNGTVLSAIHDQGWAITLNQDIALPSGTATISVPFGGRTDLVLNGNISGAGGLTIASDFSGRWVQFGGNNTYAGGTAIGGATNNNARVRIASDTALGTGAVAVNYSSTVGAQLTFMGNHTIANDISIVTGDTLTIGTGSNNGGLAGVISGTNALLRKADAGTLTLSNANTYSGATTIAAGALVIANDTPTTASSGFGGTGQLRIEPGMNSSSFASAFTNTGWTIANALTGLTIGRASNTADVTFTSPIAINGPMTIYGGDITVAGSSTDLTLQAAGQVVFDGMTVTGNLLSTTGGAGSLGGVSQTGALQVTGTSTFTADGGTAQVALLNDATNNFGQAVSLLTANGGSWQDVTLVDGAGGIEFGNVTVTGLFDVTSRDGAITQLSGTQLVIGGESTFTASNGASPNPTLYDITLNSATNDFGGVVNATGDNIELADGTDGIALGNIDASGTLAVTSTDGAITQEQGSSITVTGITTLDATNGTDVFDITLGEGSNDFGAGINARGDSITLVDGTGGLVLGDIDAAGAFSATSTAGAITQLSGTQLVIGGESTLTASNGASLTPTLYDITLDSATNDFGGVVNATGDNIELADGTDGIALGNIDASGTLAVTSTDVAVTQEQGSAITVTGITILAAANTTDVFDITLGEGSNDFGAGINARGDSITLVDGTGGLVFGDIDAAGAFSATSTDGAITQDDTIATDGTSSVVVNGNSGLTATHGGQFANVILDGTSNDFVGTVDVSGSTVTLRDVNALSLGGINASGSISVFGADVTLAAASTAGANSDIVVSATDNFFNTQGSDALNVSGTGRWVVYIGNARGNDYGNLDSQNEAVWNANINSLPKASVPAGNRYVFDQDAIRRVVVESTDATKVYGETIDLNNNYTLVATGVSGVDGAYLGTNTSSTVTAGQVFSTNPTFAATGEVATADVGISTVVSTAGSANTLFDVVYQDLGELTVTARPIELTATADTKTYGDADPTLVYTIEAGSAGRGLVNSDVFTGTADRASGENVGNYAIGQGTIDNANYAISWTSNDLTIAPRAITLAADALSKIYGDVDPTLSVSVVNGSLGSQTVNDTIDDLTGTLSRAAGSDVGRYDVLLGTGSRAGNYTVTFDAANEALAITPRPITLTADTATKVYGENDPALTYAIEALGASRGLVGNDTFSGSVTRLAGEDVGNYAINQGTVDNANYAITWTSNDLSITPRAITLQADVASKVYGDVDPTLSVSIVGGSVATAMGETLADVTGTVGRTGDDNAGVYDIVLGTGNKANNYAITFEADNNAFEIERARLVATGSKVYDGGILFAGEDLTIVGVNGETFAGSGDATMGTKNVQSGQPLASLQGLAVSQTGNGLLGNYEDLALTDTAVSVTARPVMLSAAQTTKTYDGTLLYEMNADDLTSLSTSLVGGDSVVGADLMFDSKDVSRDGNGNVLSNRVVTLSNVQIDDGNAGGNYQVTIIDANDGRINPAPLTVTAVNDAKFVTQSDPSGYLGTVYTGFVGGETEASAGVQPGQLTRSNAAQNGAGTYTDVLVASTDWQANNYEITFEAGDFTIVPADTLLVRAPALDTTYGEALPEFTTVTAQYLDSANNQIKTLAVNHNTTTNRYSTTDGAGSTATFGFVSDQAPLSTAGFAQAGGYNVAPDTNTTFSGNNFQDLVMVGSLTVAPKALANNLGINEVSKVYDGNRSVAGLDLNFDGMTAGVISEDLVDLVGNGAYNDRHVGTGKAVSLSLALRGEDANNYRLTTPTYSANVGTITQRESVTWVGQAGGSWSDSRNWEDGALPDGNNVARVVIPQSAEVFYNSDLVGATTSTITNNGTIRFASSNAFTFANAVSGAGNLEQRGTGLLTVAGNNTLTGTTDIGNYALTVAANNALGAANVVSDGGTLSVANGVTLAGLSVTGPINLATSIQTTGDQTYEAAITLTSGNRQSPLTIQSTAGDLTLNGTVSAGVNAKGAQRSLALQGNRVTIAGQIGMPVKDMLYGNYQGTQDTNPYALTVTGNEIYLQADVTTFEEQRYVGPVFIGDNGTNGMTRTLISVDPSVTFTDTVDAVIDGVHGLDVRAYSMAMALNETPTITFGDAVGQTRALADLYVDVGLQNRSPSALVATPVPNQRPIIGQVTLGGDVITVGSQTYRGNRVALGNGQALSLSARSGTVEIIAGQGRDAGVVGIDRLQLAFGDFAEVGGSLGGLLREANIDVNQILARSGLYSDALTSPQGSLSGSTNARLSLAAGEQTAGALEVEANQPSSVLMSGEVEVGAIDSLECVDAEVLQDGACGPAGDE